MKASLRCKNNCSQIPRTNNKLVILLLLFKYFYLFIVVYYINRTCVFFHCRQNLVEYEISIYSLGLFAYESILKFRIISLRHLKVSYVKLASEESDMLYEKGQKFTN